MWNLQVTKGGQRVVGGGNRRDVGFWIKGLTGAAHSKCGSWSVSQ